LFCPKTGRELEDNTVLIDGEECPCCDLTTCPNWGKLCLHWKKVMQAVEEEDGCGDKCGDICCADLDEGADLSCGCEKE